MTKQAVLSKDRPQTEVERLREEVARIRQQIAEIMDTCDHEWALVGPRKMRETLVEGVYQHIRRYRGCRVVCTKCSKREEKWATQICPLCMGSSFTTTREPWARFFGIADPENPRDYEKSMIKLKVCNSCGHQFTAGHRAQEHLHPKPYTEKRAKIVKI